MPHADALRSALPSRLGLMLIALGLATAPGEVRANDDAGAPEPFSPGWGSIDLLGGLQFGSSTGVLFAGVEATPVSIEGALALSLGVRGEAGYCALRCFGQDIHARYLAPLGFGALHLPFVGDELSLPELDAYVAATVGPAFYWFQPAPELETRRDRVWMVTPLLGVRAPFTRGGLAFAFFEASWRFALGDGRVEYGFDLNDPFDRTAEHAVDVAPSGPRLAGGLGLRF